MIKNAKLIWLILFFLILDCHFSFSQTNQDDSIFYKQSIGNLTTQYNKQVRANLSLYNGTEYFRSPVSVQGFPFFETDSLIEGSIVYNGIMYSNINMQYDIAKDEVISRDFLHGTAITLIPEKVSSFSLMHHKFIRINFNDNESNAIPIGYYEILFEQDSIAVYEKRIKIFKQTLPGDEAGSTYIEANRFYIKKGEDFKISNDKSEIINLFKDKKEVIKKYIKDNKLRFEKNTDVNIISVVKYYLALKN